MHRYPRAWHVDFSIFSQNDDGRKDGCNFFLLLVEEVYDPLYYFEGSVTDHPFPCSISQGVCFISLKEVRLHDIEKGSLSKTDVLSSMCQMDF